MTDCRSTASEDTRMSNNSGANTPGRTSFSEGSKNSALKSKFPSSTPRTGTSSGSGIPTFRSLRSLLPFGPNKSFSPLSPPSVSSPSTSFTHVQQTPNASFSSKSPFAGFGSVRRSMTKEREKQNDLETSGSIKRRGLVGIGSVADVAGRPESEDEVIAIGPLLDPVVRRSASYPRMEKDIRWDSYLDESEDLLPINSSGHENVGDSKEAPVLPSPSPIPPLPADLSTILEADTSGISKHIPDISTTDNSSTANSPRNYNTLLPTTSIPVAPTLPLSETVSTLTPNILRSSSATSTQFPSLSRSPSPLPSHLPSPSPSHDLSSHDEFDLSTSEVPARVLDALLVKDYTAATEWLNSGGDVVVVDEDDDLEKNNNECEKDEDEEQTRKWSAKETGDKTENTKLSGRVGRKENISLNLGELDPDLAALLSPNRICEPQPLNLSSSFNISTPDSGVNSTTLNTSVPPLPLTRSAESPVCIPLRTQEQATGIDAPSDSNLPSSRHQPFGLGKPLSTSLPRLRSMRHNASPSTPNTSDSPPPVASVVRQPSPERRLQHQYQPTPPSPLSASTSAPDQVGLQKPTPRYASAGKGPFLSRLVTPMRSNSTTQTRARLQTVLTPSGSDESNSTANASRTFTTDDVRHQPARPRPSLDETRSGIGLSDRRGPPHSQLKFRTRKRSMSVEDGSGRGVGVGRPSSSLSNRAAGASGGSATASSGRPPMTEWLGPRTVKAFAAAGLLNYDQQEDRLESGERSYPRVGSPALGRYGSLRSTSEYRAPSRMALSEAGGGGVPGRRGSGSFSVANSHHTGSVSYTSSGRTGRERGDSVTTGSVISPLMESPTLTDRDRERGTPASSSTAPTSVFSGSSDKLRERDRERERLVEELGKLKDKHSLETGALLAALSDSQRTTKLLREENEELRERLDGALREVEITREGCEAWKREAESLRGRLNTEMGLKYSESADGGRFRRGFGLGMPSVAQRQVERFERRVGSPSESLRKAFETRVWSGPASRSMADSDVHGLSSASIMKHLEDSLTPSTDLSASQVMSSTPATSKIKPAAAMHRRQLSATSSVFPAPPSHMSLLMQDQLPDSPDSDQLAFSSFSLTPSRPSSISVPRHIQHKHTRSMSSAGDISPTTANFSMTGSPGSLHLKPEHETHLGDMEMMSLEYERTESEGDA